MPPFDEPRYAAALSARTSIGGTVRFRERTTSTMDDARTGAAELGLASCGTAYVAGEQEAGRGRRGRRWESAPGSALLVTYHLCGSAEQSAVASAAGALATADALRAAAGLEVGCKWPNDLVVSTSGRGDADGERKLAGILAEVLPTHHGRLDVLLGIGVNLRSAAALPPELRAIAIGVVEAGGRAVTSEDLLAAWRSRLVTLGRRVRLAVPTDAPGAHEVEGEAIDVTPTGELTLRLDDGTTSSFPAADQRSGGP